MLRKKLRLAVVCLLSVTLLLALGIQVLPQTETSGEAALGGVVVTTTVSEEDQEAALAMWAKREQRDAAQPIALPEVSPEELEGMDQEPTGKPGLSPGGSPDPQAEIVARMEFPEEQEALMEQEFGAAPEGTAGVFTYFPANYYSQMWKYYPYNAVGTLYFKDAAGRSYYCAAAVISDGSAANGYRDIIVTAARCLYDFPNRRWYRDWVFYPAYRNGVAPYGSFPGVAGAVLPSFTTTGARRYDVGLLTLGNNSAGREVTYYTGYLARSWNYGSTQHHFLIGYPSSTSTGTPYAVSPMFSVACVAESFSGGYDVLGMGCNMNGSSGAPWIRSFRPYQSGAVNYVNSVVSGGTLGTNTLYGARFSSYNILPLCNSVGC